MSYLVCRIGDHCQVGDGAHGSLKRVNEGVPYFTAKNLKEGRLDLDGSYRIDETTFVKHFKQDSKALTLPRGGDVVFGIIGSLGQAYRVKPSDRFGLSSSIAMLRPMQASLDSDYLYYWVTGPHFQEAIYLIKGGVAQSYISLEMIRSLPLWLPSLSVQRSIASTVSAYDGLIENNTRRIAILEEMASRIYEEWFVRFRFPGHESVRMVESELGLVPEGWHVRLLGDEIELPYGKALKAENRSVGDVPVYGSSGVVGCHSTSLVPGPGIIVGRKGNVGSVHWCDVPFFPIDTVFYVKTALPLHFVYFNLQQQNFLNNDAAVPGLNRNQAYALPLLVPDLDVLKRFEDLCGQLLGLARLLSRKNVNLRTTRDLLLPKLISGELDMSTLPEPQALAA